MRGPLIALALVGAAGLTGCFEPFRVHVDEQALQSAPGWVVTRGPVSGGGLDARSTETRYTFDGAGANAPYPGTLQVFSVRAPRRIPASELLEEAERIVEDGAADHHITLDGQTLEGGRRIAGGVTTRWFVRTGTTTEDGALFDDQVRTRILGEVGHDGRSSTSFLAVAIVQVERTAQCPLGIACQPQTSEATWIQVVGDPEGTVGGATSSTGFIDRLVTH